MPLRVHLALCAAVTAALSLLGPCAAALADPAVLEAIRTRGHVVCGVSDGPRGYASVSPQGVWSGINIDYCRALASAVLGSRDAVQFRLLAPSDRFSALQSGDIDVLSVNLAMTSSRDTTLGIRFAGVLVYDGQGFLVRKSQGVASALELSGARVCVTTETGDEQGVSDYFAGLKVPFDLLKFDKWSDAAMAYANKSCQVLTADISTLASTRQQLADAGEHIILPEIAAKQLVGPAVRQGDEGWYSVVRWTVHALVAAEEFGITSANVDTMKATGGPEVRRFLALDMDLGKRQGLSAEWTLRVIKQVGNYGELFDRHLGPKSAMKLERRHNNLATNGGLHYAPAFR